MTDSLFCRSCFSPIFRPSHPIRPDAMDAAKKMVDTVTEGVKKASIGGEKGAKKEKKGKPSADNAAAGPLEMNPPPEFLKTRLDMFDRLKKKHDEEVAKKPREKITVTMPDGSIRPGTSWETTPGDIAKSISNSLYKRTVVARLDNKECTRAFLFYFLSEVGEADS